MSTQSVQGEQISGAAVWDTLVVELCIRLLEFGPLLF